MVYSCSNNLFNSIIITKFRISPYSGRMRENKDQKNSKYGHFSSSDIFFSIFFLGGAPRLPKTVRNKFTRGFSGCFKELIVDGKELDFTNSRVEGFNIYSCGEE